MENPLAARYEEFEYSSRVALKPGMKKFLVGAEISIPGNSRGDRLSWDTGDQRAGRKGAVDHAAGRGHGSRPKLSAGKQSRAPTDPYAVAQGDFFGWFRLGLYHQIVPGPTGNEDLGGKHAPFSDLY